MTSVPKDRYTSGGVPGSAEPDVAVGQVAGELVLGRRAVGSEIVGRHGGIGPEQIAFGRDVQAVGDQFDVGLVDLAIGYRS